MKRTVGTIGIILSAATLLVSCANNDSTTAGTKTDSMQNNTAKSGVTQAYWGEADGKKVSLYTLTNSRGVQVKISNYGGVVTSWVTPDKAGKQSSIVLGYDSLQGYLDKPP